MEHWSEYTRFLTALVVIVDPVFAVPVFLGLTRDYDRRQRARAAAVVALTVALVLTAAALLGEGILRFLGTSLASFRVGGGLVLLLMALAMLQGRIEGSGADARRGAGASVAVVPLAIPLLAGPGAISAVIIQTHRSAAPYHGALVIAVILAVCALLWVMLRLASPIAEHLTETRLSILSRLFGLILAAIAVEIMANGLRELFPVLAG
jgi:multiple antibiotic resistance protein